MGGKIPRGQKVRGEDWGAKDQGAKDRGWGGAKRPGGKSPFTNIITQPLLLDSLSKKRWTSCTKKLTVSYITVKHIMWTEKGCI